MANILFAHVHLHLRYVVIRSLQSRFSDLDGTNLSGTFLFDGAKILLIG